MARNASGVNASAIVDCKLSWNAVAIPKSFIRFIRSREIWLRSFSGAIGAVLLSVVFIFAYFFDLLDFEKYSRPRIFLCRTVVGSKAETHDSSASAFAK